MVALAILSARRGKAFGRQTLSDGEVAAAGEVSAGAVLEPTGRAAWRNPSGPSDLLPRSSTDFAWPRCPDFGRIGVNRVEGCIRNTSDATAASMPVADSSGEQEYHQNDQENGKHVDSVPTLRCPVTV